MEPKVQGISVSGDLIRTVAIMFVIVLHATGEPNPTLSLTSLQGEQFYWSTSIYGALTRTAVPLFVMLTGVLLLQPMKADEPWTVFFKKRWLRIGIPFIFWGAIYIVWDFTVVNHINNQPLSINSVIQGILNVGPAYQFWYLYLLIGLYLLTPLLRIFTKNADLKALRYLILVWFVGIAVTPILTLFTPFSMNANLFLINGWIGYFILGLYLIQVHVKRSILFLVYVLSTLCTILGAYFFVPQIGSVNDFFIQPYSFNLILASASLFLLLSTIPTQTIVTKFPRFDRVVKVIGQNTLPIFFLHVIVLEALQVGYFGFKISVTTMNPIMEIPLISAVTLLICLAVILPLNKIPQIKRIIG